MKLYRLEDSEAVFDTDEDKVLKRLVFVGSRSNGVKGIASFQDSVVYSSILVENSHVT